MHCPAEIADTLLSILRTGILRVRSLAWQGQVEQCGIESDHIHNLPDLIADYAPEKLAYYWNVERVEYMRLVPREQLDSWESLWRQLRDKVEAANTSQSDYAEVN
jgi:hypothetical protein